MASGGTSSINLAIPSFNDRNHAAYSVTALGLAAAFHHDFLCCTNDTQRREVCCNYRDKILGISHFTDLLAEAFNDAFPQSLRDFSKRSHTKAWAEFASLVQRRKKSQSRESQRLQHQTSIVSIWGRDVFEHYCWHKLPLESTRLLNSLACVLRQWDSAVELINDVLLERHEDRVVHLRNNSQLIGEHPRNSKIQDHRSPVKRQDIQAVLDRVKKGSLPVHSHQGNKGKAYTIAGTPIHSFGLEQDDHGMIVPRGKPGVIRESSSPAVQANKRRKTANVVHDSPREAEDLLVTSPLQQPTASSPPTTESEMTEFEEESCVDLTSVSFDGGVQTSIGSDLLWYDGSNADVLTPDSSADMSVSVVQCLEKSRAGSSARRDTSQDSHMRSPLQNCQVSSSIDGNTGLVPIQHTDMPMERQKKDESRGNQASTMVSRPMHHQGAASFLKGENNLGDSGGPGGTFSISRRSLFRDTQGQQQHFSFSNNVEEFSRPASFESSSDAVTTIERSCSSVARESGPLVVQSFDPDIRTWRERVAEEEMRISIESGAGLYEPENIATPKPAIQADCRVESNQAGGFQSVGTDQAIDGETMRDSEVILLPEMNDRSTPAITSHILNRYCTDASVEDGDTVVGRMAYRYVSLLQDELEAARRHSNDHSVQEQNKLKVKWLEKTRWANLYNDPTGISPRPALPLNVDIWYMEWDTFQTRADAGELFFKPIVIKQKFQDSGMHELPSYLALLKERYPNQVLDLQNTETGKCQSIEVEDFWAARSHAEKHSPGELPEMSNAVNLRKIANADAPLLTRLKRFRLLETLIDRAAKLAPGKRTFREANDISDCLGFDLLGFKGAFTRPHVDALMGTWIRCLSGTKAWIFAPGMSGKDWDNFTQEGPSWSPAEKGRIIVLEKDDVLLMPPGIRVLHTVFTLEPSLMEGGMLWDECNIPSLLDELLWVSQNQLCTNEAIAYQLPSIIDALEGWVKENHLRLSALEGISDYLPCVEYKIGRLRDLGCKCVHTCARNSRCQCRVQSRRCTAWCLKHPALPESAKNQGRDCMFE
jgi:hypothetical protein